MIRRLLSYSRCVVKMEKLDVNKYTSGGEIVNNVLLDVISMCQPKSCVSRICKFGDSRMMEELNKIYKTIPKKGISFPTCVSINECICYFSPDSNDVALKSGDLVKIELGVHIDGFVAEVCHSVVIGASNTNIVDGRKADVVLAAYHAAEAAIHLLQPGNKTSIIEKKIQGITDAFSCKPIIGMLSHQLEQFLIDNRKSGITLKRIDALKKEHELQAYEVYAIDITVSTGIGEVEKIAASPNIFKRTDNVFRLKSKQSREFLSQDTNKYGSLPFHVRGLENLKDAKERAIDCITNQLMEPFDVLYEKPGELVARFKFTAIVLPKGTRKITGLPLDTSLYKSIFHVSDTEKQSQVLQAGKDAGMDNALLEICSLLLDYDDETKLELFKQVMDMSEWKKMESPKTLKRAITAQIKKSTMEELLLEVHKYLQDSPYDILQASLKIWAIVAGAVKIYLLKMGINTITHDSLTVGVEFFVESTTDKELKSYGLRYWENALSLHRYQYGCTEPLERVKQYVQGIEKLIVGIKQCNPVKDEFLKFLTSKKNYNIKVTTPDNCGYVTLFNATYEFKQNFLAVLKAVECN